MYKLFNSFLESLVLVFSYKFYVNVYSGINSGGLGIVWNGIKLVWESDSMKLVNGILTPVLLVFATEVLVDWLKHAFIIKFNGINPDCFQDFRDSLCRDLMRNSSDLTKPGKSANIDRSPAISRRIGFVPIPLACLALRVSIQIFRSIGEVSTEDKSLRDDRSKWKIIIKLFNVSPAEDAGLLVGRWDTIVMIITVYLWFLFFNLQSFNSKNHFSIPFTKIG
jgi:hypothetical protein